MEWAYFNKFNEICDKYLPRMGEGETMASQIVTAVCKLVYKWYNDGDVYDNTRYLQGWWNNISSYANWLHQHTSADSILEGVWECHTNEEYEQLLANLADTLLDEKFLEQKSKEPKVGSVYEADGPFEFVEEYDEYEEDEEDEEW